MQVGQKTRAADENAPASVRLSSWKEIAAYLNRDPRTVQLWEKSEGLPVHRLAHQARASVYAYSDELDAWLRNRSASPAATIAETPGFSFRAGSFFRRPMGIASLSFVLITAGVAMVFLWASTHKRESIQASNTVLAILPFEEQTSSDGSLADNLTESLITDMGRIGKVPVISRQSILQFKGQHLPLPEIASRLQVSRVLRGTVAKTGSELTVTVELLDAPRDTHLWGLTFARKVSGNTISMNELASEIAFQITRQITGSVPSVVLPVSSPAPKAKEAYLEGRFNWNRRDLPSLQKAIACFSQAIAIDPQYAEAYAGLAETYDLMTDKGVLSNDEAFRRAKSAARRAIALDSDDASAYNALAFATYRQDWDFERAEQYFKKAVGSDPNYAVAHQWYGEFLGDLRRFDQSIAELRKAKELDPLSPMVGSDLADGYLHAGRLGDADAELRRILELYPDFPPAHGYHAELYALQSNFAAAEGEAQAYLRLTHDRLPLQTVEIERLVSTGDQVHARDLLHQMLSSTGNSNSLSAYRTAQLYFHTGQEEQGNAFLDKAFKEHSWWLVTMMVDPAFSKVRGRPHFLEIAHRVGLPDSSPSPQMAYQAR